MDNNGKAVVYFVGLESFISELKAEQADLRQVRPAPRGRKCGVRRWND